ncbi:MAG TPA: zinc ribbon domain-containing protein [Spirochaetota bacterium]|nr:zinc ribbon domain-containing protein [Spirochaetota bacterium]HOM86711.1 zinc ribbon domain-containing protein [Spirochaetota bacterium]HOR93374.1 zinc ribbon domain-containing protein [Spirochaetota bacterium]HOT19821.1 zinc ribbon domain-containing protein [Spirochaetota bacterium]HPD05816.1 zinc ribbon domain-containing protein [Spirochaetota bacterium]
MKSIKLGKATSFGGFVASIIAIIGGIGWTLLVISLFSQRNEMENPVFYFFVLFGIIFIGVGIAIAVFSYKNLHSKNGYSLYDIVDSSEEKDAFHSSWDSTAAKGTMNYCPHCGTSLRQDFIFCPGCGKKL